MKGSKVIVGVYSYLDDMLKAARLVKEAKLDHRAYAPTYNLEMEEALTTGKSPVRRCTLSGALLGCTCGWTLAVMCSLDWPMRSSAKDIVSLPGFFVIGYEWTILFGAIGTLLGLLYFCRLPDVLRKVGYDPRFSDDKFGLVVGCDSAQIDEVRAKLLQAGADEVQVREGL